MYFNDQLDKLAHRANPTHCGQSFRFTGEWMRLPQRLEALKDKGQQAGYDNCVLSEIDAWFDLNNVLNYYLRELAGKAGTTTKSLPTLQFGEPTVGEQGFLATIRDASALWQGRDWVSQAILLRAFSSVGFAKVLLALAKNRPIAQQDAGLVRRVSGMVMATQLLDDTGTPVKDKKCGIAGMISLAMSESKCNQAGRLNVTSIDAQRAVAAAFQIFNGCRDVVRIDPTRRLKQAVAAAGLGAYSVLSICLMLGQDGGTGYPLVSSLRAAIQALTASPKTPAGSADYRETTKQALGLALGSLLNPST
jgi:hypothetical protein